MIFKLKDIRLLTIYIVHQPLDCIMKVSIITPTYNHEEFIENCITSVLNQTYSNWEMIIIDDGSTDSTGEIIKKFRDQRIKYIRQKHRGIYELSRTYNLALRLSKGELIAILEGDDFWEPEKLERQVEEFKRDPNLVLCWSTSNIVDREGNVIGYFPKFRKKDYKYLDNDPPGSILKVLLKWNFIPSNTVIIRKSFLIKIGGFKQIRGCPFVDYPTYLELSLLGRFKFIKEVLGNYRRHSSQVTSRKCEEVLDCAIKTIIDFYNSNLSLIHI